MAATSAACQTVWLRKILTDLKEKQNEATIMFCDNKSTTAMTKNPIFHGRIKHIEIHHLLIRELVARKEIKIEFCNTKTAVTNVQHSADSVGLGAHTSRYECKFRFKIVEGSFIVGEPCKQFTGFAENIS
ncbi:Retrovirus-related Pol polyprotein from transposon TNT 1-94 [Cinnamomum micranthum f. kanehirae]|uniref:Retrovirus-related Pol polyprotein from transposon TNT 1-94 n=1 Tax=Cinnamomum micranthum f. kanehirae TaxID=337451 RepID=A0A3S3MS93_9MAGN|nr:Retrovirus-related Pol polyprotein from transposon TNT 1-94 [Cinnamomum micranthum f. kanehirae]